LHGHARRGAASRWAAGCGHKARARWISSATSGCFHMAARCAFINLHTLSRCSVHRRAETPRADPKSWSRASWGAKDGHATGGWFFFRGHAHGGGETTGARGEICQVIYSGLYFGLETRGWLHRRLATHVQHLHAHTLCIPLPHLHVFLLWQLHPIPPLFRVRRRCSAACNNWRGE
jgi:hypothetical protein